MGGLCDLSDTDESAIEEIISQAQDACVLEQVSAINCSAITDSALPTDLESRFRKLKSFPATKPKQIPHTLSTLHKGNDQSPDFSPSKENPDDPKLKLPSGCVSSPQKKGSEAKSKHGSVSLSPPFGSASGSSHTSEESSVSSVFKPTQKDEGKRSRQKSLFSSLGSSNSLMGGSPSPPRKVGFFWCSPKKEKKKSKENNVVVVGWDKSDELLSDFGSFSSKQQQKMLKKALKEEEKISREAEKIVEWAKHASARMNVSGIDDELSDD
ncbi:uncharacterized protein LOC133303920 [Gastrolobium bilobum]|uniref:uncharacterized protein LOC133303920 n=1 Tax=Gastrolobium bilobum TaxID=150636 RepID=UPI002AB04375|nr:uncharacterized protein LOC133303920 [Gastrolobium bilobum]